MTAFYWNGHRVHSDSATGSSPGGYAGKVDTFNVCMTILIVILLSALFSVVRVAIIGSLADASGMSYHGLVALLF